MSQQVQRDAQQLQNALDHIQAIQMRLDSTVSYIKATIELKAKDGFNFESVADDLIQIDKTLLEKVVPVLTGQELPKRG